MSQTVVNRGKTNECHKNYGKTAWVSRDLNRIHFHIKRPNKWLLCQESSQTLVIILIILRNPVLILKHPNSLINVMKKRVLDSVWMSTEWIIRHLVNSVSFQLWVLSQWTDCRWRVTEKVQLVATNRSLSMWIGDGTVGGGFCLSMHEGDKHGCVKRLPLKLIEA